MTGLLICFLFLQALDVMTTMLGLLLGGTELNPVIRWAIGYFGSSVAGILVVKSLCLPFMAWCGAEHRERLLLLACYWFGAVVFWNFLGIALAAHGRAV